MNTLDSLLRAKELSDTSQYSPKARIMFDLMTRDPQDFQVDSTEPHGGHPGVTHTPTGFRMHVPWKYIPASVGSRQKAPEPQEATGFADDEREKLASQQPQEDAWTSMPWRESFVRYLWEQENAQNEGLQPDGTWHTHGDANGRQQVIGPGVKVPAGTVWNREQLDAGIREAFNEHVRRARRFYPEYDNLPQHAQQVLLDTTWQAVRAPKMYQAILDRNYEEAVKQNNIKMGGAYLHRRNDARTQHFLNPLRDYWGNPQPQPTPASTPQVTPQPTPQVQTPQPTQEYPGLDMDTMGNQTVPASQMGRPPVTPVQPQPTPVPPARPINLPPPGVQLQGVSKSGSTEELLSDQDILKETDTQPTEAQREAGNYRKARMTLHGLDISIENPRGSVRSGTSPDGTKWEVEMKHHYGYIRGRGEACDGDHPDCFIGLNPESKKVWVVDQVKANGHFDEPKILLGFNSEEEATEGYLSNYEDGWKLGEVTGSTLDTLNAWLDNGCEPREFAEFEFQQYIESRREKRASVQQPQAPTGSRQLLQALHDLNLDDLERQARETVKNGPKSKRGEAIKRLNIIEGLRRNQVSPGDLMITKVPVLPAQFRPYSAQGTTFIPGDSNVLYKDLMNMRRAYDEEQAVFGDEGAGSARGSLYDAVKAVYGYGPPTNEKARAKGVTGFLEKVTGTGPKTSYVSRRLLGKTQDQTARGTIIAAPDLGMDEVGIPREMGWSLFAPYVQRRLVRGGMSPGNALKAVKEKSREAERALEMEIPERPVVYSRSPAWHKWNTIAGRVKLTDGDGIGVNPFTLEGLSGDFDGDAMNIHLPATEEARMEALEKLLPSKMVIKTRDPDDIMSAPRHEQILGLYTANNRTPRNHWTFPSEAEALKAIQSGRVSLSDEVEITGTPLTPPGPPDTLPPLTNPQRNRV